MEYWSKILEHWNEIIFSLFPGVEDHICQENKSSDESSMDEYEEKNEKNINISEFNAKYMNYDGEVNGENQSKSDDDGNDDDSICDSFYSSKLMNDLLNIYIHISTAFHGANYT